MRNCIRITFEAAENGGMVAFASTPGDPVKATPSSMSGPLYIIPKVDPKTIGETVLLLFTASAIKPADMDVDDIDF